jgi:FKBP-type peptidyl-prolyl cis-trans isomerase FklB
VNSVKLATLLIVLFSSGAFAQEPVKLESNLQKFAYYIGLRLGDNLRKQGLLKLDVDAVALGIRDFLDGAEPRLTNQQMQEALATYQQQMQEERLSIAKKNRDIGKAFLEENKTREGVLVLDSGVQYQVITEGTGENPTETDKVVVHYRGYLLDGTEFDSSFSRNQPAELEISQVIAGWQDTLKRMNAGSKWKVWIPSDLAYGLRGAGSKIGPNETLYFDIELLSIKEDG